MQPAHTERRWRLSADESSRFTLVQPAMPLYEPCADPGAADSRNAAVRSQDQQVLAKFNGPPVGQLNCRPKCTIPTGLSRVSNYPRTQRVHPVASALRRALVLSEA